MTKRAVAARLLTGAMMAFALTAVGQATAVGEASTETATHHRGFNDAFGEDRRVFTDNIGSGSECDTNDTGSYDCMSVVINQVASWSPDAISVDEACQSDVDEFEAAYPNWDVRFVADAPTSNKCAGQAHGNFVAAPNISDSFTTQLENDPNSPYRDFKMICAQTGNLWICTAHLPYEAPGDEAGEAIHETEINQMESALDGKTWAALCGDFNMKPGDDALNDLTSHNWKETDPSNMATTSGGDKLDYIWWHKPDDAIVKAVDAHIVHQPDAHFQHDMLQGRVDW